ncbi:hypothetical protein D9623_33460 (plasmid) [Azospirillum brasilense]|uniref:Uncharacterized protein n=1 Tax=Azospirillum brasilense TaxID=192 RepID=A0A4D8QUF2_AZOBR|nr:MULTISPECIES: hypothetical protein [Azospirillum]YP_001686907.1 hypothetical protein APCd_gp66 [Azospirillum phage Cd]MDW7555345.1 hypothetical protein [Azospirillum brasilense]MDW7595247.1 hypothetical protein [Azospirillum brasilense]MDW7630401.1 hypothetical protein [Azospirillum brasilense]MDX5949768.1 hypothetical protein [Azospirillum brasilense]OPH16894.1 hypothetical protein FE89_02755 [Azospirillum brasilense]
MTTDSALERIANWLETSGGKLSRTQVQKMIEFARAEAAEPTHGELTKAAEHVLELGEALFDGELTGAGRQAIDDLRAALHSRKRSGEADGEWIYIVEVWRHPPGKRDGAEPFPVATGHTPQAALDRALAYGQAIGMTSA